MGGIILVASIVIWFLGYFPKHSESGDQFDRQIAEIENTELDSQEKTDTIEELERLKAIDHQQNSYIGRIGQTIQPVLAPLGFDWKMSVSLLTGMAAKEVVVSTLSVLYTGNADDDSQALSERLKQDRNAEGNLVFTPLIAISLMLFVLIYFPCIATISAIVNESGSWKWGIFVIIYTCVLAWIVSFIVYQTGNFFVGKFIGMWQDIAVCVIGISIIGYIAYKVYRMLTKPKSSDPCCGCSGCSLKKEMNKINKRNIMY